MRDCEFFELLTVNFVSFEFGEFLFFCEFCELLMELTAHAHHWFYPAIDLMKSADLFKMDKLSFTISIFIQDVEWNDDVTEEQRKEILVE